MERRYLPPYNFAKSLVLRRLTNQAINNVTFTNILFTTTEYIDSDVYSYNTDTGVITVLESGIYLISLVVPWANNAVGSRLIYFNTADPNSRSHGHQYPALLLGAIVANVASAVHRFPVGGTITPGVYQDSGGALNVIGTNNGLFCEVHKVAEISQ